VLGGLIGDKVNETIQKVPVLGSIPYLGALFRSTSTNYTKQHLMVFLRATIVRDKKDMSAATGAKYRLIRNQRAEMNAKGTHFFSDDELPMLPEWVEQMDQLDDIREQQKNTPATKSDG
jgi:general secretion pathway protein D